MRRAKRWRWSSLGQLFFDTTPAIPRIELTPLPLSGRRGDWVEWVNQPQTPGEDDAVRRAMKHSRPYGSPTWTRHAERLLKLGPLRPRGRPEKKMAKSSA